MCQNPNSFTQYKFSGSSLLASIFLSLGAFRTLYAKRSRLWSCRCLHFSSKYSNILINLRSLNPVAQWAKWLQAQVYSEKTVPKFLMSRLNSAFPIDFRRNYVYAWEIRIWSLWSIHTCLSNSGLIHSIKPSLICVMTGFLQTAWPNPTRIPSMGNEEQTSVTEGFLPSWPSLQWWWLKRQSHL